MWKQTSKRYPPKDHLRQSLLGLSLGLSLIALSSPVKAHATEELPSTAAEKAQQDQITFVILDAATREPIIGAVVRCVGATTPAMTDKNGRCTLRFKTAISSAQLDISCVGYQRVTRTVAVPAGKAVNVETAFVGLTNTLQTPAYTVRTNEGSCTSRAASFVPEAGHDYEVVGVSGKACGVAVYDIAADGSLKAVPLANAVKCSRR